MTSLSARHPESGFTLLEVLISLALFALIGLAGFTLVDGILRVERRTDQRLEHLGDLQRAMHLLTADVEQLAGASLDVDNTGIAFRRFAGDPAGSPFSLRYELAGGALRRVVTSEVGRTAQPVLGGVTAWTWQFYTSRLGWIKEWPPAGGQEEPLPAAVAVTLAVAPHDRSLASGLKGDLRRVIRLPAAPLP